MVTQIEPVIQQKCLTMQQDYEERVRTQVKNLLDISQIQMQRKMEELESFVDTLQNSSLIGGSSSRVGTNAGVKSSFASRTNLTRTGNNTAEFGNNRFSTTFDSVLTNHDVDNINHIASTTLGGGPSNHPHSNGISPRKSHLNNINSRHLMLENDINNVNGGCTTTSPVDVVLGGASPQNIVSQRFSTRRSSPGGSVGNINNNTTFLSSIHNTSQNPTALGEGNFSDSVLPDKLNRIATAKFGVTSTSGNFSPNVNITMEESPRATAAAQQIELDVRDLLADAGNFLPESLLSTNADLIAADYSQPIDTNTNGTPALNSYIAAGSTGTPATRRPKTGGGGGGGGGGACGGGTSTNRMVSSKLSSGGGTSSSTSSRTGVGSKKRSANSSVKGSGSSHCKTKKTSHLEAANSHLLAANSHLTAAKKKPSFPKKRGASK